MNRRDSTSPIEIARISGHWVNVPQRFLDEVGDFQVNRFELMPDGQARLVKRSLFQTAIVSPTSAGFTFPSSGLTDAMLHAAREQGIPIRERHSFISYLPAPVVSPSVQNPVVAGFIHTFPSGIIEFGGTITEAQIVAEVCLAFPQERVLVVSAHRKELRQIQERVPRYAPSVKVIDVSDGHLPGDVQDVSEVESVQLVLCTPATTAALNDTSGTDAGAFPIVLYLNARRAKDLMTKGFLLTTDPIFKIFGLRHVASDFDGEEREWAYNVFGPACVRVPDNGFERSQVSYVFLNNPFKLRNVRRRFEPLDAIRLVPHCTERNNLVGDVARALIDRCRFKGDELVQCWLQQHQVENPGVAIIVRNFQHAVKMARRLPAWSIFLPDGSDDILVGLKSLNRRLVIERAVQRPGNNPVICPAGYLPRFLEIADPEITIDATGGERPLVFPNTWFRHPAGTHRQRLVIDIFDGAVALTRRISGKRMTQYEHSEFYPVIPNTSQEDLVLGLPLMQFVKRTFQPVRRKRRSQ